MAGIKFDIIADSSQAEKTFKSYFGKIRSLYSALDNISILPKSADTEKVLKGLDTQIRQLCNNANVHFEDVRDRFYEMLSAVEDGKKKLEGIKVTDSNKDAIEQQKQECEALTAAIEEEIRKIEEQRSAFNEMSDSVSSSADTAKEFSDSVKDSAKNVEEASGAVKNLSESQEQLSRKTSEVTSKVQEQAETFARLVEKSLSTTPFAKVTEVEYEPGLKANILSDDGEDVKEELQNLQEWVNEYKKISSDVKQSWGGIWKLTDSKSITDFLDTITEKLEGVNSASDLINEDGLIDKEKVEALAAYVQLYNEVDKRAGRRDGLSPERQISEWESLRSQINKAREEVIRLKAEGKEGTPEFDDAIQKAAGLTKELEDVNQQIEYTEQGGTLEALKDGAQGVVGVFSLANGVIGLFNKDSEKMVEIQTRIQSLMAIIVGLQQAYTFWTKAATIAQHLFNVAAKANPYMLLVSAIGAVVGALIAFKDMIWSSKNELKGFAKVNDEVNKQISESVSQTVGKQIEEYGKLKAEYEKVGKDIKAKERFIRDNEDAFNKLGFAVGSVSDAEALFTRDTDDVIKALERRAKAAALTQLRAENYAHYMKDMANLANGQPGTTVDEYEKLSDESKRKVIEEVFKRRNLDRSLVSEGDAEDLVEYVFSARELAEMRIKEQYEYRDMAARMIEDEIRAEETAGKIGKSIASWIGVSLDFDSNKKKTLDTNKGKLTYLTDRLKAEKEGTEAYNDIEAQLENQRGIVYSMEKNNKSLTDAYKLEEQDINKQIESLGNTAKDLETRKKLNRRLVLLQREQEQLEKGRRTPSKRDKISYEIEDIDKKLNDGDLDPNSKEFKELQNRRKQLEKQLNKYNTNYKIDSGIQEQLKRDEELAKARKEGERASTDAMIAAIRDNAIREREERRVQHERTIEDIKEQENDTLKEVYNQRKADYERKNPGEKYEDTEPGRAGWSAISVDSLSGSEKEFYDARQAKQKAELDAENSIYDRYLEDRARKERTAVYEFLKTWGDYEQQKLAITKEYEEKISNASSVTERASLSLERDKEIEKLNAEKLNNEIDWEGVFSDLQGHTKEYLEGLRDQLQSLLQPGKVTDATQLATIQEKIIEINAEVSKQGGLFSFVGDRQREHTRLVEEAAAAQERLKNAVIEEASAQTQRSNAEFETRLHLSGMGISAGPDLLAENGTILDMVAEKFGAESEEYKNISKLLDNVAIGEGKLAKARQKTEKATNEADKAENKARIKAAQGVADWFSDAQQFISQQGIDQIPGLLNDLGLEEAGEKAAKGLSAFNNAAGAAADFASGNYVGAAIKAFGAITDIVDIFVKSSNREEIENANAKLARTIEVNTEAIGRLTEAMDKAAPTEVVKTADEAIKLMQQNEKNARQTMLNNASLWDKGHSLQYNFNEDNRSLVKEIFDASKHTGHEYTLQELLETMSAEDYSKLLSTSNGVVLMNNLYEAIAGAETGHNYNGLFQDIVNFANEYNQGKYDDIISNMKENVTGLSFDSMYDSFVDKLMDMDAEAEDFADDFEGYMKKAVIKALAANNLKEPLQDWMDAFTHYMGDDDLSATEMQALMDGERNTWYEQKSDGHYIAHEFMGYNDIIEIGSTMMDAVNSVFGGGSSKKQSATANSISNISYDQANALEGILLNHTILHEQGNATRELILENIQQMNIGFGRQFGEISTLTLQANETRNSMLKVMKERFESFDNKLTDIYRELQEQA